jgi:photosystem II stability/assembly factor-like uncharacterized protein
MAITLKRADVPAHVPGGWTFLGPRDLGGPTRALVIHPTDPSRMWVACAAGGVWRSLDAGRSWSPVDDPLLSNVSVLSLVLDPSNPRTLYAGTGPAERARESTPSAGIFKSSDAGATWTQLDATVGGAWGAVNRLAIARDGSTLLAATRLGLFRSVDHGASFQPVGAPANVEILDVDFHPSDRARCLAAGKSQVLRSTDSGTTWQASTGLPDLGPNNDFGRTELTFAKADPEFVYASVNNNQGEIYRSTDGGRTFVLRSRDATDYLANEGWYHNTIWAGDPRDPNLVIVGGLDLYRSTDGGAGLEQISFWYRSPQSPAAHHHAIVESPLYDGVQNKVVYFGNNGGIYQAEDVRTVTSFQGWQVMNKGYSATQFNGAAGDSRSQKLVGGTRSSGTLISGLEGSGTWAVMFGGQGGLCAIDPTDPQYVYGEYVNLRIFRSTDGGRTASFIFEGIPDAGDFARSNSIAPFVLDRNDPKVMLAGGSSLWRSRNVRDAAPQWGPIKAEAGSPISAIAVAAKDSNIIWVGHNDGQVFKTVDGLKALPAWERLHKGGTQLPGRVCTRIVIDPGNPEVAYVTFGGFSGANLWKTTNGGTSFQALGDSLPAAPIYCLAIHPADSQWLFLGNQYGVFTSRDGGLTWSKTNEGPVNSPVRQLFWMNQSVVAATYGRGMFQIDVARLRK